MARAPERYEPGTSQDDGDVEEEISGAGSRAQGTEAAGAADARVAGGDGELGAAQPSLDVQRVLDRAYAARAAATRMPPAEPGALLGEVTDSHHPRLPGRLLTRWLDRSGAVHEHWLLRTSGTAARKGDRVLLSRPLNFAEYIVTAVLSAGQGTAARDDRGGAPDDARLSLLPDQSVAIAGPDGRALVELSLTAHGPVLKLLCEDLEVALPGRFRVSAEQIELVSGQGGTDLLSDGEMVLRSPRIRLN